MSALTVPVRSALWPPRASPVYRDPDTETLRAYLGSHHVDDQGHVATVRLPVFLTDWLRYAQYQYREDAKLPLETGDMAVATAAIEYAATRVLPKCSTVDQDALQDHRGDQSRARVAGDVHPDDTPRWTAPYEEAMTDHVVKVRIRQSRWGEIAPIQAALGCSRSVLLRHLMAMAFLFYDHPTVRAFPDHRGARRAGQYAENLLGRVDRLDV